MDTLDENLLTPRNLLGVVIGIYDPLRLTTPKTARLRVLFRGVFQSNSLIDWDAPIFDEKSCGLWMELLRMLVSAGKVTFPRIFKPKDVIGNCQFVSLMI